MYCSSYRQVDEEVADVVNEVDMADESGGRDVIDKQRHCHRTHAVNCHDQDELNHSYVVTFTVL